MTVAGARSTSRRPAPGEAPSPPSASSSAHATASCSSSRAHLGAVLEREAGAGGAAAYLDGPRVVGRGFEHVLVGAVVAGCQQEAVGGVAEPAVGRVPLVDAARLHLDHLVAVHERDAAVGQAVSQCASDLDDAPFGQLLAAHAVMPHQRVVLLFQQRSGRAVDEVGQHRADGVLPVVVERFLQRPCPPARRASVRVRGEPNAVLGHEVDGKPAQPCLERGVVAPRHHHHVGAALPPRRGSTSSSRASGATRAGSSEKGMSVPS